MQYKEIQANNGTIAIGYIGDNLATKVLFDTTEIIQTYGDGGSFELLVKQQTQKHGDGGLDDPLPQPRQAEALGMAGLFFENHIVSSVGVLDRAAAPSTAGDDGAALLLPPRRQSL